MTGVLLKKGHLDTCIGAGGGEGQVKTEAEIRGDVSTIQGTPRRASSLLRLGGRGHIFLQSLRGV